MNSFRSLLAHQDLDASRGSWRTPIRRTNLIWFQLTHLVDCFGSNSSDFDCFSLKLWLGICVRLLCLALVLASSMRMTRIPRHLNSKACESLWAFFPRSYIIIWWMLRFFNGRFSKGASFTEKFSWELRRTSATERAASRRQSLTKIVFGRQKILITNFALGPSEVPTGFESQENFLKELFA